MTIWCFIYDSHCFNCVIDKFPGTHCDLMEAIFLVQPWVQACTAIDCCKLCYQERDNQGHLECKRAHLGACNSLLAILKLEKGANFEDSLKRLEEAKEKCVSTAKPDEICHGKSQDALKYTLDIYDTILEDYKKRLPNRQSPTSRAKSAM